MSFSVAVTRPAPFAAETADALSRRGYEPLLAPLLLLNRLTLPGGADPLRAPGNPSALALTSRTAARLMRDAPAFKHLPAYCVGSATAREAAAAGFSVVDAKGTVDDLFHLLSRSADRLGEGPVLHLSGADQRGDLVERLNAAGISAERRVIYKMEAATTLPPVSEAPDAVLLYSPRTARVFARLATLGTNAAHWRKSPCVALSPAVAEALAPLSAAAIAARPDEAALFDALAGLRTTAAAGA
ncbi:MAG: uroporphyrinogen-III synthase [Pseudomonadota bacterium]